MSIASNIREKSYIVKENIGLVLCKSSSDERYVYAFNLENPRQRMRFKYRDSNVVHIIDVDGMPEADMWKGLYFVEHYKGEMYKAFDSEENVHSCAEIINM